MKRFSIVAILLAAPLLLALDAPLGNIKAWQVACGTTATKILPPDGYTSISSFEAWNNSATIVYVGGPDVNTTTRGMPFCTAGANCIRANVSVDGKLAYCRVAAGTVTLTVISGVE